jgi:hypothetical protein
VLVRKVHAQHGTRAKQYSDLLRQGERSNSGHSRELVLQPGCAARVGGTMMMMEMTCAYDAVCASKFGQR